VTEELYGKQLTLPARPERWTYTRYFITGMAVQRLPQEPGARSMIPSPSLWLLGLGAFGCTLAGGVLALRLGRNLRFITGLSAGAVVGLALFELIPEAAQSGGGRNGVAAVMLAVGVGFCLYMAAQRLLERLEAGPSANHLGPASLTLHSFFDGLSMGLAFKVSPGVGFAVAAAILAHDLCDGVNTVTVALRDPSDRTRRLAARWLWANASAPLAGILLASLAPLDASVFTPLVAGFAGVFLYIGAAELLPRSLDGWRSPLASLPPITGVVSIYVVSSLAR
jgi:zinc transporter ZupT